MQGWIKLHRRIIDHWIWQDPEYLRMWIYLLLDVNHEDRKVVWNKNVIEVKRGEKITSLKKLSEEFNCSRGKVRHFLKLLVNDTMIYAISNTNYTHIKVCNYDNYQIIQHTDDTLTTHPRHTDDTLDDTNKNDKNDKNDKKKREYAPAVFMTEEEYQKLVTELGNDLTKEYMKDLSLYLQSKGKRYKSHYATILAWHRKDEKEGKVRKPADDERKEKWEKKAEPKLTPEQIERNKLNMKELSEKIKLIGNTPIEAKGG